MRFVGVLVVLVLTITTAFADLIGHYKVSGTRPDGSSYSGEVVVELVGDTIRAEWEVEGRRYVGTGIENKNFVAISYRLDDEMVVALYVQDDTGRWQGTWTYVGSDQIGTERWRPYTPDRSENQVPR